MDKVQRWAGREGDSWESLASQLRWAVWDLWVSTKGDEGSFQIDSKQSDSLYASLRQQRALPDAFCRSKARIPSMADRTDKVQAVDGVVEKDQEAIDLRHPDSALEQTFSRPEHSWDGFFSRRSLWPSFLKDWNDPKESTGGRLAIKERAYGWR